MSLGPDARSLIETASGGDDPSEADAARVRRKLASRVATAAAAGTATAVGAKAASGATGAAASAGIGTSAKIVLVVALAIGAGVPLGLGLVSERSTNEHPSGKLERRVPPKAAHSIAPTASIETEKESALPHIEPPRPNARTEPNATAAPRTRPAEQSGAPSIATTSTATTSTATTPSVTTPSASPDSVAAEAALLREARAALARGDSAEALTRLDAHAARFPLGALAEERQATRVFALCASGRGDEARTAAESFLAASPRSPLAERVRRACAARE